MYGTTTTTPTATFRSIGTLITNHRQILSGFGFLSFENDDAVNNVVSEHYVTINGKKVESHY